MVAEADRLHRVSVPLPSLREMHFLSGLPGVRRQVAFPLRDTGVDPGLFGPGSVTWRVLATPLMVLGGTRALLMQVANPLIAEGVLQHSNVHSDPFRRLTNTATWVSRVAFGTTAEADAAVRGLAAMHRRVNGTLGPEHATAAYPAGSHYDASQSELLRWVHATLIDSMLVTHETLVGRLTAAEADRFVREWNPVAERMGVPVGGLWQTREELRMYVAGELLSGRLEVGAGSREVSSTVLESPLKAAAARSAWPMLHLLSVGLLGEQLRNAYGLEWGSSQRFSQRALVRTLRGLLRVTPAPLRRAGVATYAVRRSRGDFAAFDNN